MNALLFCRKLRDLIQQRLIKFFIDQSKKDAEKYAKFFEDYGLFMREGIVTAAEQEVKVGRGFPGLWAAVHVEETVGGQNPDDGARGTLALLPRGPWASPLASACAGGRSRPHLIRGARALALPPQGPAPLRSPEAGRKQVSCCLLSQGLGLRGHRGPGALWGRARPPCAQQPGVRGALQVAT